MLRDIVIDTNVFLHAENAAEMRQPSCQRLIKILRDCDTSLCLDEGFDTEEAKNRSHIGGEYLRHLRFGMVGYELVSHLAQVSRLKLLPRKVPVNVSKQIRRQINKGPDRIYVQVAYNSDDKIFTSHDLNDLPDTVRKRLKDSIEVKIETAEEVVVELQ